MATKKQKRLKKRSLKNKKKTEDDPLLKYQLEGGRYSRPGYHDESANRLSKKKTGSVYAFQGGRASGK